MKWHFRGNKEMNWLAFWNCLLGVVSIPINLMIASSLVNAVSAMADGNYQGCFHYVMVFGAFTILRLTILVIKSSVARLTGKASQAFRQSLYQRFVQDTSLRYKSEATRFTTLFRRDAQQIATFYSETLPAFGTGKEGTDTFVG